MLAARRVRDRDRGAESGRSERGGDGTARPSSFDERRRENDGDRCEHVSRKRERGHGSHHADVHGSRGGGGDKDARRVVDDRDR